MLSIANIIISVCQLQNVKIEITDSILEQYKPAVIYFNNSPKKEKLLEYIVKLRCYNERKRKVPLGMCGTRTSEREMFYEYFYLVIPHIPEAFEVLNGAHPELQSLLTWVVY